MYWCEYCQKAEEPVQKREEQYHDEVDTRNYEVTYIDVCPDCGHELYLTADECPICGEFKDARHDFCHDCEQSAKIVVSYAIDALENRLPDYAKSASTNDLIDALINELYDRKEE
jgi:Oxygen-sensitive ribonucleoside-triphosphate reductase